MRMLIDNRDLELLLEKKKKFIGNKVTVDTMIAGISFCCPYLLQHIVISLEFQELCLKQFFVLLEFYIVPRS